MCDKELLVGYLYDELAPAERSKFEAHLFACAECREEIAALRATRAHLAQWAPPEPNLGFQIVRAGDTPVAARRFRVSPAWGLAAAAVLLLAVASAIANLDVTIGGDGVGVRTGWSRSTGAVTATAQPPSSATPAAVGSDDVLRAQVRQLEAQVRALTTVVAARENPSRSVTAAAAPAQGTSHSELLREVRNIVAESRDQSETRLLREVALRLAQHIKDEDLQRRSDLARIEVALGRIEAYSAAEDAQQRQILSRFVRVSQGR